MDFPIWCFLSAMLLAAAQAGMTDQGPQMFSDPAVEESSVTEKKQYKREPQFKTKEVILYLTPSQIRAYESGKGLIPPQQAAQIRALEESQGLGQPQQLQPKEAQKGQGLEQTEMKAQLDLSPINEQLKEQQNALNDAAQREMKEMNMAMESKQNEQMQVQDVNKPNEDKQQLSPENSAPQTPRLELEKREKYVDLHLPLHYIPQSLPPLPQPYHIPTAEVPPYNHQFIHKAVPQIIEPQLLPSVPANQPHLTEQLALHQGQPDWRQQNYAYLYFYPSQKPVHTENVQFINPQTLPHLQAHHRHKELFLPRAHHPIVHLHPKFQLVPYEYGYENKLEAQQILQAQLDDHKFNSHHFETHKLESHQLDDIDTHQILIQKHLEPQYPRHYEQKYEHLNLNEHRFENINLDEHKSENINLDDHKHESKLYLDTNKYLNIGPQKYETLNLKDNKYEPKEIKLKILPHTAALLTKPSKEIQIDLKKFDPIRQQEMKDLYEAQKLKAKIEAEEKEAKRLDEQLKQEELKAEQFKLEQLYKNMQMKEELYKNDELKEELFQSADFKEELFKADEFKDSLFKPEQEKVEIFQNPPLVEEEIKPLQINDDHSKMEQLKQELIKNEHLKEQFRKEYEDLGYLQKLEPKRTQMYSILNPLFQGHSIVESLQQQKSIFPHHKISLETGFKPLQYAPKYNDNKYAREVEKMSQRNRIEKEKALAKAAAIANEPPEIIHSEEIFKNLPEAETVIKQEEIPESTPVTASVPAPYEVKIPQQFPVPLEIIRPYPISVVKLQKVEVHKPVPIEIEKHVPVPVTKNVYVKVDKPYFVKKIVPVEVKKEIPVEVPIHVRNPLKLSIVKHVWNR